MFSLCVCVCVCVSICLSVCLSVWAITFEGGDMETSFFGVMVHLDHVLVKFEYQGH